MPRSTRPFQSQALSSDPIHMPGIICTGPSMYGTEGEPPSSSFRRRMEVVGFMAGKDDLGEMAATESKGDCKEVSED